MLCGLQSWFEYMQKVQGTFRVLDDELCQKDVRNIASRATTAGFTED